MWLPGVVYFQTIASPMITHDDDERHHRVVEHRVRVERLAALLDVLLVLLEDAAALDDAVAGHQSVSPARREPGQALAPRLICVGLPFSGPVPAASFDHGGEVTPSRITRYRCRPISAKIAPGISSMWIA